MTTKEISEIVKLHFPDVERNNRICRRTTHGFIRAGFPEPKGRETDDDLKGGDFIGWTTQELDGLKVARFVSVEVKGPGDRLKPGQKRFHNKVLDAGGIALVYSDKKGELDIFDGRFEDV